jgi:hypothetical protein
VAFFAEVLRTPIPPERSHDIHHHSTVGEEVGLRIRALQGLATLAARANEAARDRLLEQLNHPSFAVRCMACLALRELPGAPLSDEELRRRLPREDVDRVLALRRASIQEISTPVEVGAHVLPPRPPGGQSGSTEFNHESRRPPRIGR